MKILMVLTSHDELGDSGRKTGFWLEEFTSPYYAFKDAGVDLTLASPKGGQPPLDPRSDVPEAKSDSTQRFKADPEAQRVLARTRKLARVVAGDFDAVFYPGGHGPLWDLAEDPASIALIEAMCSGMPLIATQVGGNEEIAVDGRNGFLIGKEDPAALAVAMMKFMNTPGLISEFSKAELAMRESFAIQACARKYEDLYGVFPG